METFVYNLEMKREVLNNNLWRNKEQNTNVDGLDSVNQPAVLHEHQLVLDVDKQISIIRQETLKKEM